ncbi:cell adhesion molecule-related/down-regulated by oncogenes-like [Mytilus trossulus]|uniref:cell adhesion molecule-related/down-regulated by oncogenes-like n=1 Tax=Mytilus trossulus TaxID=6551 RepID=UPI003005357B
MIDTPHHEVEVIQWKKENVEINDGSKYVISGNAMYKLKGNTTLTINNVQSSDIGDYFCNVENKDGMTYSEAITLNIHALHLPSISVQTTYNANIGDSETFQCTISSPQHVITDISWTKGSVKLSAGTKYTISNNGLSQNNGVPTLTINNIQSSDSGIYNCYADNQDGQNKSLDINLHVKEHIPIVSILPTSIANTIIGGSVTLTCTITSSVHPLTSVSWTKNIAGASQILSTVLLKYTVVTVGLNQNSGTSTLLINDVSSSDEANYFCIAENEDGVASSSTTLQMSPQITTKETTTEITTEETTTETKTEETTTLQKTSTVTGGSCTCHSETVCTALKVFRWAYLKDSNLTFEEMKEEMKEYLDELKSNLTVDKKTTTAAIRRKISVRDLRTSAVSLGASGIVLLIIPTVFIFTLDLTRFIQYIQNRKRTNKYK